MDRSWDVYLAGPLFTFAQRGWNHRLSHYLSSYSLDVYVPQDEVTMEDVLRDSAAVYQKLKGAVLDSKVLLANLDGPTVDDGTAFEVGVAASRGVHVIGYRSDFRQAGDAPNTVVNLMLSCGCDSILVAGQEEEATFRARICQRVQRYLLKIKQ